MRLWASEIVEKLHAKCPVRLGLLSVKHPGMILPALVFPACFANIPSLGLVTLPHCLSSPIAHCLGCVKRCFGGGEAWLYFKNMRQRVRENNSAPPGCYFPGDERVVTSSAGRLASCRALRAVAGPFMSPPRSPGGPLDSKRSSKS